MSPKKETPATIKNLLAPRSQKEIDKLDFSRYNPMATTKANEKRIQYLGTRGISTENLSGKKDFNISEDYKTNIENFVGMAQIPVGLAGPILINGSKRNMIFSSLLQPPKKLWLHLVL